MKKIITVTLIAVVCLTLAVLGTYALNSFEKTTVNVVTMGNIKIKANQSEPPEDVKIVPASETPWEVTVENIGEQPAYIRVAFDKNIELAQGVQGVPDTAIIGFDIDSEYWEYKDGYYYYKQALEAGKESEPVFTKMIFDKDAGDMYQGALANAKITVYATQVKNNGDSAVTALGWPEEN